MLLAHDEAATYFRQALDLLPPGSDESQRCELLIALGEAQRRAGDSVYGHTLLDAARLAAGQGNTDALARAALANSRGILMSPHLPERAEALEILRAAIEATAGQENTTRAELLSTLAFELTFTPSRDERLRLSEEALRVARRVGDPLTLTRVLISRFYTVIGPDTVEERLAYSHELAALAETLEDPVTRSRAWFVRARAALEIGDVPEHDRVFAGCQQLADELAQPTLQWAVLWGRLGRVLLAGDVATAERLAREAAELGHQAGQPDADPILAYQLFSILREQDRLHEIESLCTKASDMSLAIWTAALACLYADVGRLEEARHLLDQTAQNDFHVPVDLWWWHTTTTWASLCAVLHAPAEAAQLYRLLTPWESQIGFPTVGISNGAIAYYLGLLAAELSQWDEADDHFRVARTIHQRIDAPIWLARTMVEWARMLLARRKPADREPAHEMLREALGTARTLGVARIERDAVALLGDE